MSDSLHLLFLTKYARNGASSRYRTYQYLPYLEEAGFDCTVSPLFDEDYLAHKYRTGRVRRRDVLAAFMHRLGALLRVGRYDLVVIEYELFPYLPALSERWLNWRGIPYVADYDDALFHQYDQHRNKWVRCLLGRKIARVMKGARLVTAGNSYLADYARRSGARQVEIIPTVIDLDRYPDFKNSSENDVFTIGWIGSPSTAKYVEQIAPALREVCADGAAKVRLIGSGAVDLPGVPHEVIPWSDNDEVWQLQQVDAGIMPLPDTSWERGKCGFKLIQYMACGLPVVASPVGVNQEIVVKGVTGFFATSNQDWEACLVKLRDDNLLRMKMGACGRNRTVKRYTLYKYAPRLAEVFRAAIETRKPPPADKG